MAASLFHTTDNLTLTYSMNAGDHSTPDGQLRMGQARSVPICLNAFQSCVEVAGILPALSVAVTFSVFLILRFSLFVLSARSRNSRVSVRCASMSTGTSCMGIKAHILS